MVFGHSDGDFITGVDDFFEAVDEIDEGTADFGRGGSVFQTIHLLLEDDALEFGDNVFADPYGLAEGVAFFVEIEDGDIYDLADGCSHNLDV